MRNERLIGKYFTWLLGLIETDCVRTEDYSLVLEYLFNREFTWIIRNDANRASDGLDLRFEFINTNEYAREIGSVEDFDGIPCSVLEALVALAINWEHEITYDFRLGDRSGQWFWTMIKNLGLLDMPNWRFDEAKIEEIVDIFLYRKYDYTGKSGIFPIKSGMNDQRKLEIWLQLQEFVLENVEI